jgi:hypothetical protein
MNNKRKMKKKYTGLGLYILQWYRVCLAWARPQVQSPAPQEKQQKNHYIGHKF